MPNNLQNKSDADLIALVLQNQDDFIYLIRRYEAQLLRYIKRISNFRQEDAEDILQDVFIKVYQNLNDFDPRLKFSSWIYRITHNQVISFYRKNKKNMQAVNWEFNDDIINNLKIDFNLEQKIDGVYLRKKIESVFKKLDFKYAQVLELKFLESKNYQEISDILQKPIGTISTLINRAKKRFKEEFNK
jgi:RNA polymerase sigma-70 factor (ECF subfamily)